MPNLEVPNSDQRGSYPSSSGTVDFTRQRLKSQEIQETNPSGDGHSCKVDKDPVAKDSFQKDFDSRKTALGINHPKIIESLCSLVEVHEKLKDFQGIKNLLNENDENSLLNDAPATSKTADILHCLGTAYLELIDLKRAAEMFVGELSVRAMAKGLGPSHPTVAKPFDSLSTIYKIEAESKLQEHKFQEALQANKMEENCLRRALDVLTAVRQSLDPSKRSNPQRIQEVNPSDNEDKIDLEKRLEECLKRGSEIKWKNHLHKFATHSKSEDLKDLTNRYDLEVQTKPTDVANTSQSELDRPRSDHGKFVPGKIIDKPNDPSSSHSADHQELEQPEQVAPSEMTRSTRQGDKQRGLGRLLFHLLGGRSEKRSQLSWKRSDTASSSRENLHEVLIQHKMLFQHRTLSMPILRDVLTWKKS
jgi:hypothetical protein